MQDLTELTDQLDLDAALARTHERHRELLHERAVRRRFVTTGAFAAVIVAAVVLLPQLGSDDRGQAVRFAGPGGSSTAGSAASQGAGEAVGDLSTPHLPRFSAASSDFSGASEFDADDQVVFVLTRRAETLPSVPTTVVDDVRLGSGIQEHRHIALAGDVVPLEGQADVVTIGLACTAADDEVLEVRYRFAGSTLLVDATVRTGPSGQPCAVGQAGPSVSLPLDRDWDPAFRATAAEL